MRSLPTSMHSQSGNETGPTLTSIKSGQRYACFFRRKGARTTYRRKRISGDQERACNVPEPFNTRLERGIFRYDRR